MKKNTKLMLALLFFFYLNVSGQEKRKILTGKVSFVTSTNIYVKFDDTKHIKIGDTLKFLNQVKPCLVIINKSSKSVVCTQINNCAIKNGDELSYYYTPINVEIIIPKKNIKIKKIRNVDPKTNLDNQNLNTKTEYVRGKLSAASYSNFSSTRANKHKLMYRFSMIANHINNSKISFETYLNYKQYLKLKDTSIYLPENKFNVYNFALKYDVDSTMSFTVGRKINNKTSSLGAIDGLQAEKFFGKNYLGIIAGFRPDINDYNFNSNLLEFGGYIGRAINTPKLYAQTTLGILQQNNNGKIDRKYAYFQHSSTIFKKLNIFSSMEFDLYHKIDTITSNKISLTNLYTSARYKFSRKVNLMLSYDSRKKILYYETFQTEIERLLNDNEARQGLRVRMNIKPSKFINTGLSFSKRFQSSTQNKSININSYLSINNIPNIGGRLSINYNKNTSSYLESNIISFRYSKELVRKKLNADFYFRKVGYNYVSNNITTTQNYYGTNLSLRISKSLKLNVFGEVSIIAGEKNEYRINTAIVKRFKNKKQPKRIKL